MAAFLSTKTSRECIHLQAENVSKSDGFGGSFRDKESFETEGEYKRRRRRTQKDGVLVPRTGICDLMVSEGMNSAHSCNDMQKEDMDFCQSGRRGVQSCTETPREGMIASPSGTKDPHLHGIQGPYSYSVMPKEVMVSSQSGISYAHSHHAKDPHSCSETPKEDMAASPSASDNLMASDGMESGQSHSIRGLHSYKERQKDEMFSENGREIAHSYATERSYPYSKMHQSGSDDIVVIENVHSHRIESPHSANERRKQELVPESDIGNANSDALEGSNPSHSSPDKTLKRPEKLLPCPRCESLDTKFCYFNNYNVNQPRHFCRKCQRYWTAGGSLRNLPVGAGRRKNKHVVSHPKHQKPSDIHTHVSKSGSNETVSTTSMSIGNQLSFSASLSSRSHGSPIPMGSTSSMVDLIGKKSSLHVNATANLSVASVYQGVVNEQSSSQDSGSLGANGENSLTSNLRKTDIGESSSCNETASSTMNPHHVFVNKGLVDQCSATESQYPASAMVTESPTKEKSNHKSDSNPTPTIGALPFPFVGPWQFVESSTCANMSGNGANIVGSLNCGGWNNVPPGMWGGFPWPLIPMMWGPFGNTWNMQWNPSTTFFSSGGSTMPPSLATVPMPKCGVESTHIDSVSEPPRSLWVPKTLRIGDPVEAARSSIWTTLGLDDSPGLLDSGRGITAAFKCKTGSKKDADHDESRTQSLHTNPAALSRSATFNEKI